MILYQQIFFTTLALAFALLHVMLYAYNRQARSNLYFALFLVFYALNIFFDFQAYLSSYKPETLDYLRLHRAVMPINPIFNLLFLYSTFNNRIPRQFWLLCAGLAVTGFLAVLQPIDNFAYIQFVFMLVIIEVVRVTARAVTAKKPGAWIIAAGFFTLFLFSSYDLLMDLKLIPPIAGVENGYPFGFGLLIIFISVYQARNFARMNEQILAQERERKAFELEQRLLQAEDARKTKELEEARALQLSMLPQCITGVNGYDICFDMRPASEVGGDYYDYVQENGSLTVAIGDATGHGIKAGIMVSIVKSLFQALTPIADIPAFFAKCSETIRQMRLGQLYMALMLVKIAGSKITVSSAGMPPFYVYRAAHGVAEEFVLKGMPLGAVAAFPYQTVDIELAPGDALLLLSDGLPELFDKHSDTFGDKQVKELFTRLAPQSATAVVRALFAAADDWRGQRLQNDDITFFVLKAAENGRPG